MDTKKYTAKDFATDQEVRWCPGCGDYSILKQVQTVMPEIGLPKEDIVFITISDNGSGIAKKDWKNIFKPGFSSKKGGWGLGLSLVRRIVEEIHNGKVQILSSSPGIGTTFEIKLKPER